jgi:hypothetical protein
MVKWGTVLPVAAPSACSRERQTPPDSDEPQNMAIGAHVERLKGIEPSSSVWKTEALPLSYSRELGTGDCNIHPLNWLYGVRH